ncbi:hypothetical protein AMTR_s00005p00246530 [Amborella trichopoda]|uniref:Uncharacterized protein n=1 Tax=Amborella trichopoda TaxID=13333 RepID=W1PID4_AMBTC|nr:hypothetical protein AMTR_s00005p00246530 [Amborella trichopoda]
MLRCSYRIRSYFRHEEVGGNEGTDCGGDGDGQTVRVGGDVHGDPDDVPGRRIAVSKQEIGVLKRSLCVWDERVCDGSPQGNDGYNQIPMQLLEALRSPQWYPSKVSFSELLFLFLNRIFYVENIQEKFHDIHFPECLHLLDALTTMTLPVRHHTPILAPLIRLLSFFYSLMLDLCSGLRQRPQVLDPDVGVPDAYPVANLRSNCIPSASALQRAGIISFEGNCTGSLRIEFFAESGDHLLRRKLHRLPQDRVFCRERGSSPTKGAAQAPSGSSFFGSCTGSLSCNGTLIIPCMRLNKFAVDLLLNMLECGSSMPWLCLTTASYVMVMRDLVREPNDVPVLCSAGILENDLSSNADASVLFTQVFYSGIASRWWPPFPLVSYESIRLQVNSRKQPVMARLFMTFSILVIGLSIIQTLYTVL